MGLFARSCSDSLLSVRLLLSSRSFLTVESFKIVSIGIMANLLTRLLETPFLVFSLELARLGAQVSHRVAAILHCCSCTHIRSLLDAPSLSVRLVGASITLRHPYQVLNRVTHYPLKSISFWIHWPDLAYFAICHICHAIFRLISVLLDK